SLGELELSLRGALEEARRNPGPGRASGTKWLSEWFAPAALNELLSYRTATARLPEPYRAVGQVILSRAARSARQTTHFDLDFPREPAKTPYYCFKHKKTCRPVETAAKFLSRYTTDTIRRIRAFAAVRTDARMSVVHDDSRTV